MMIDCDTCVMQHTDACDDCVVSFLVGVSAGPVELGEFETEALGNLAEVGLVPRLKLVTIDTNNRPRRQAPPTGPERAIS